MTIKITLKQNSRISLIFRRIQRSRRQWTLASTTLYRNGSRKTSRKFKESPSTTGLPAATRATWCRATRPSRGTTACSARPIAFTTATASSICPRRITRWRRIHLTIAFKLNCWWRSNFVVLIEPTSWQNSERHLENIRESTKRYEIFRWFSSSTAADCKLN